MIWLFGNINFRVFLCNIEDKCYWRLWGEGIYCSINGKYLKVPYNDSRTEWVRNCSFIEER